MRRRIKLTLLASTLLMTTGCTTNSLSIGAGLDVVKAFSLTDEKMKSMAVQSAKYSDKKNHVAPSNSAYTKRLQQITRSLKLPNSNLQMNYKVYLTSQVNAFAMEDGTVRVYSGLMKLMNDDELRFVLGHEIGHVYYHHNKSSYRMTLLSSAARKGAASAGGTLGALASGQVGALTEKLINAQYSQSEENEADSYGLKVLQENHRNQKAAVSALLKLAKLGGGSSIFDNHPAAKDRAESIKAQIQ